MPPLCYFDALFIGALSDSVAGSELVFVHSVSINLIADVVVKT